MFPGDTLRMTATMDIDGHMIPHVLSEDTHAPLKNGYIVMFLFSPPSMTGPTLATLMSSTEGPSIPPRLTIKGAETVFSSMQCLRSSPVARSFSWRLRQCPITTNQIAGVSKIVLIVSNSDATFQTKHWVLSLPEPTRDFMMAVMTDCDDVANHCIERLRGQPLVPLKQCWARIRWERVQWAVKVRPYALHWLSEANASLCAPDKKWSEQDKRAYAADFHGVAEDDAPQRRH